MLKKKTQKEEILKYFESGGVLTPIDALRKFGCFRLAAIVFDLKKEGHDIKTRLEYSGGKKFAKYKLNHKTTLF
tara:strand:+ start:146 stop:367 length:222 start_codon:yes stop_codon:yes gene_type:complete